MKINALELINFRQVKQASLKFSKGMYLISGENGSGKTTMMLAVALLVFDYSVGNLIDYINWDADFFEIKSEFEYNGILFKERIYYNIDKKSERELYVNLEYYKGQDATNKLAEFFDPKLYLASMMAFEGEIDLISTKPSERREHLKKIYDLSFDSAIKDLDFEIKKMESDDLTSLDKNIFLLENLSFDLKQIKKMPFEESEKTLKEKQLFEKKLAVANYERDVEHYNSSKKELNILENEYNNLEKIINQDTEKINNSLKEKQSLKDQDVETEEKINNEISNTQFILENSNFEVSLKEIQEQISEIKILRVKTFDESLLKEKEALRQELGRQRYLIDEKIKLCKSGNCPTCGHKFDSVELEEYKFQAKKAEEAYIPIHEEVNNLLTEREQLQSQKEEQEKLKNKLSILKLQEEQELKNIENEKLSLKNKIDEKKEQLSNNKKMFEIKLENLENAIKETQERTTVNRKVLIEKEEKIKENKLSLVKEPLKIDESIFDGIKVLEKEISNFNEVEIYNKEAILYNEQLEVKKQENAKQLEILKKEKVKLIEDIEDSKKGKQILQKEFPNYVISTTIKSLENSLNQFIYKTYGGRYNLEITDKKDSINILYGEGLKEKKEVKLASGYEKKVFSLAWKYALSQLTQAGVIFLDEPDAQASDSNSQLLFNVIGEMKELFQQVFIISHKEETKELLINEFHAKLLEARDSTIYF